LEFYLCVGEAKVLDPAPANHNNDASQPASNKGSKESLDSPSSGNYVSPPSINAGDPNNFLPPLSDPNSADNKNLNQLMVLPTLSNLLTQAAEQDERKEAVEKQKSATAAYRQRLGIIALVVVVLIALVAWRGKKIFSRKQAS